MTRPERETTALLLSEFQSESFESDSFQIRWILIVHLTRPRTSRTLLKYLLLGIGLRSKLLPLLNLYSDAPLLPFLEVRLPSHSRFRTSVYRVPPRLVPSVLSVPWTLFSVGQEEIGSSTQTPPMTEEVKSRPPSESPDLRSGARRRGHEV